jgi:hypothetical protein
MEIEPHKVTNLSVEQQMLLNINRYNVEEVAERYTRKQLAKTIVYTTCYSESLMKQYKEFKTKEDMVLYIIEWLDECFEDLGYVEDLIETIDNCNNGTY